MLGARDFNQARDFANLAQTGKREVRLDFSLFLFEEEAKR